MLLEDYHLIEKLAQFDRERIPERVVHARGATAKGFFEVSIFVRCALHLYELLSVNIEQAQLLSMYNY